MEPSTVNETAANADEDLARARRKQAAVRELICKTGKTGKNSLGMIQDTALAREAFALGEAYRRAQHVP